MKLKGLFARKALVVAVMSLAALNANAQRLYVGGSIGLGGNASGDGISLYLAPDVSYAVSNSFIVGGRLSYRTGYDRFAITPYARWHIMPLGTSVVSVFLTATVPCQFTGSESSVALYARPGLAVRIGTGTYLTASVGYAGYCWNFDMGHVTSSGWTARLDPDCIDIGVSFCL